MKAKFIKPTMLLGLALLGFGLAQKARVDLLEPTFLAKPSNVACLKGSPYGRTMGLALQGPIVKFWDHGLGSDAGAPVTEDKKGSFGDWIAGLNEKRMQPSENGGLSKALERHVFAKIEKKLSLAWQMDPRNYSNYSIYQMFLFESLAEHGTRGAQQAKDLSIATIRFCASDAGNPYSMLTGAQAAYDIVLTASHFTNVFEGGPSEVISYSQYAPEFLNRYDQILAEMKQDGRWENISAARQQEMEIRRQYLHRLNQDTENLLQRVTEKEKAKEGGLAS